MNAPVLKSFGKQVGMWGSLLIVVALLTGLFSILGTITAAALCGMIMGASRRCRWQTILASAVFALTGFVVGQVAKADLELRQRLWIPALTFGTYWGVYLMTFLLMSMEKANPARPTAPPAGAAMPGRAGKTIPISLRDLEGRWHCESNGQSGQGGDRMIEITEHRFALKVRDAGGRVRLLAEGDLRLETGVAGTRISLASASPDSADGLKGQPNPTGSTLPAT
jgi:hypothetical protein